MPEKYRMSDAIIMGPELCKEVERQLISDLTYYTNASSQDYKFDWSKSSVEGHLSEFMDGKLENFSNIGIANDNDEVIGFGWMDYVLESEENIFLVYWEFLNINGIEYKKRVGIPPHIWNKLPSKLQNSELYRKLKLVVPFWEKSE